MFRFLKTQEPSRDTQALYALYVATCNDVSEPSDIEQDDKLLATVTQNILNENLYTNAVEILNKHAETFEDAILTFLTNQENGFEDLATFVVEDEEKVLSEIIVNGLKNIRETREKLIDLAENTQYNLPLIITKLDLMGYEELIKNTTDIIYTSYGLIIKTDSTVKTHSSIGKRLVLKGIPIIFINEETDITTCKMYLFTQLLKEDNANERLNVLQSRTNAISNINDLSIIEREIKNICTEIFNIYAQELFVQLLTGKIENINTKALLTIDRLFINKSLSEKAKDEYQRIYQKFLTKFFILRNYYINKQLVNKMNMNDSETKILAQLVFYMQLLYRKPSTYL